MAEASSDVPEDADAADPLHPARQFLALPRDVLVLSVAMLAFSLAFQVTSRYVPEYMGVLGAGPLAIGLFKSLSDLVSATYPYPGGALSDRFGSRLALTAFGLLSAAGFVVWLLAPALSVSLGPLAIPAWGWILVGLLLTQAWKSLGLGATFAVVKQSVAPEYLATGFASTETFRRVGFLLGPLVAAGLLLTGSFVAGFQAILLVAIAFALVGTTAQHVLYDASRDTVGKHFEGLADVVSDLRSLPDPLRPLLVADTLIRLANGMVYAFVIRVITTVWQLDATLFGVYLPPGALFGLFLAVEMAVALVSMLPVSRLAERTGLKPVVGLGFLVYAVFPALFILAPQDPLAVGLIFAFSGLRFAGLPAHKALIVGPAEVDASGRVTGTYYLVRNTIVIPSGVIGGWLYAGDPATAFVAATLVGLAGVAYFATFGQEFAAYAS